MPSNTLLSRTLDAGANLTVDGALATELEAHGCDLEDPLWSAKVLLEQPELVKRVHHDYFRAGATVAITVQAIEPHPWDLRAAASARKRPWNGWH